MHGLTYGRKKSAMQRGARFNILHRSSKTNCHEISEKKKVGGAVEIIGDKRGRAEGGRKHYRDTSKDHIRGETFVQKDPVYGVVHACAA